MSQKSPKAIKGRAVSMESRGKEHHDVSLLLPLLPDVLVGHLPENQWRGLLPHPESSSDSLVRVVPTQLLRVVLDAGDTELTREGLEQHSLPEGIHGSAWARGRESLAVLGT